MKSEDSPYDLEVTAWLSMPRLAQRWPGGHGIQAEGAKVEGPLRNHANAWLRTWTSPLVGEGIHA